MAVDFQTTINGTLYTYSPDAIRDELANQGVASAEIERVLTDISQGYVSGIRQYGLEDLFVGPGGGALTPALLDSEKLASVMERDNVFDMLQVLYLLHESGKELRQANREMRHADRDAAMAESYLAADKIRSAALTNLVMGVVQGAVSIGMAAVSLGASIKQGVSMKAAAVENKAATLEMNQVKADQQLAKSQVELKQVKSDIQTAETKVQDLKQQQGRLEMEQKKLEGDVITKKGEVKQLQNDFDAATKEGKLTPDQLKVKGEALDKAKTELADAETAVQKNRTELDKVGKDLTAAENRLPELRKTEAELEGRIKGEAVDADKANKAQTKAVEKSVKEDKAESAKLEKQIAEREDKIKGLDKNNPEEAKQIASLEKEVSSLKDRKTLVDNRLAGNEVRLKTCQENQKAYAQPTSKEALDSAQARFDAANEQLGTPKAPGPVTTRYQNAQTELNEHLTKMQTTNTRLQAAQMGVGGINQAAKGVGDYAAAADQAEGAEHTANAQKAQSAEQENADFQKAMNDLVQEVQNLLKQALQAQNQANASIYRNM